MKKAARNTVSKFGAERARQHIQTRFNPIRGLTPAKLSRDLDAFAAGDLRNAALLWEKILERDDQVITCRGKRARKVKGLNWEILPHDDSPEAARHKEALEAFYRNLTAVNALDENQRGGIHTLLDHMHSAVGMRYAFHEIVWKPGAPGTLSAEFRFIPLQFFENTRGRLRFCLTDFAPYGEDSDDYFGEGGWMVTAGEGLMISTSVAYMFKSMPLKAWVGYVEKYGTPPLHAQTPAAQGSEEWEALKTALGSFGEDLALITNTGATITPIELKAAGSAPHPLLVDRMDRAISRIWLGGDLATMSQDGSAVGSQPQSDGLADLVEADCAMVNDALRWFVDRWVVRYLFGDVEPLAYFELQPPAQVDVSRELLVDEFLLKHGVPRGKKDLLERYGRPEPDPADELAETPAPAASPFGGGGAPFGSPAIRPSPFGNRQSGAEPAAAAVNEVSRPFRTAALQLLAAAHAQDLGPLRARLEAALSLSDDRIESAVASIREDFPALARAVLGGSAAAAAHEQALGTALVEGAAEARRQIAPPPATV